MGKSVDLIIIRGRTACVTLQNIRVLFTLYKPIPFATIIYVLMFLLQKLFNLVYSTLTFQENFIFNIIKTKGAASPKLGGHEFRCYVVLSQSKSFPTVYDTPMSRNIGMSYTVIKLRNSSFQRPGGHERVFVSMVAAPLKTFYAMSLGTNWRRDNILSVMLFRSDMLSVCFSVIQVRHAQCVFLCYLGQTCSMCVSLLFRSNMLNVCFSVIQVRHAQCVFLCYLGQTCSMCVSLLFRSDMLSVCFSVIQVRHAQCVFLCYLGQTCSVCVSLGTNGRRDNFTYCDKEIHSGYCAFNADNKPECHCPAGYKQMPNKMGCMVRIYSQILFRKIMI